MMMFYSDDQDFCRGLTRLGLGAQTQEFPGIKSQVNFNIRPE